MSGEPRGTPQGLRLNYGVVLMRDAHIPFSSCVHMISSDLFGPQSFHRRRSVRDERPRLVLRVSRPLQSC
jgi:hypothetical protein